MTKPDGGSPFPGQEQCYPILSTALTPSESHQGPQPHWPRLKVQRDSRSSPASEVELPLHFILLSHKASAVRGIPWERRFALQGNPDLWQTISRPLMHAFSPSSVCVCTYMESRKHPQASFLRFSFVCVLFVCVCWEGVDKVSHWPGTQQIGKAGEPSSQSIHLSLLLRHLWFTNMSPHTHSALGAGNETRVLQRQDFTYCHLFYFICNCRVMIVCVYRAQCTQYNDQIRDNWHFHHLRLAVLCIRNIDNPLCHQF